MRILISAYACEPDSGSEPAAGWEFVRLAAERHQVWVLTRANNRQRIEAAQAAGELPGVTFRYLDLPPPVLRLKRLPYGTQAYYLAWQRLVRQEGVQLHRQVGFDLVHHVTFAADWMPAAALDIGVPASVWGPVGGATGMAWSQWRWLGWRGLLREIGREAVTRPMRARYGRRAARTAGLTLAQNFDVEAAFAGVARRLVVEPNVVVAVPVARPRPPTSRGHRRAVFVGRLIPHKGVRIAIAALAEAAAQGWSLDVLGDGPERVPAERLARRLGVADRVAFRGSVPHAEVIDVLCTADALLAPSMYEGSGFAVAEAVACGCPVVCTDRGGPAVMVRAGRGIRVPVSKHLVPDLASGLNRVPPRLEPTDLWSAQRLRRRLDEVYTAAVAAGRGRDQPR